MPVLLHESYALEKIITLWVAIAASAPLAVNSSRGVAFWSADLGANCSSATAEPLSCRLNG